MFAEVSVFYLWPSQAEVEIFMGWGWFGVWNRVPGLGAGGEGWGAWHWGVWDGVSVQAEGKRRRETWLVGLHPLLKQSWGGLSSPPHCRLTAGPRLVPGA